MAKAKQNESSPPPDEPQGMFARRVRLDTVQLDSENARKHGVSDIDAIGRSLAEFGQQSPIVLSAERVVLKGNGTVMAARKLGWEEVWAVNSDLDGSRARAYALADNKTGLLSSWDEDRLEQQMRELAAENEKLMAATGFSQAEVEKFFEEVAGAVSGPPGDPVEIRGFGRIWLLVGAPPDKGLEMAELSMAAVSKLGVDAFVETSIGN